MTAFNDLELALRKLPGVRSAGFTERDDVLVIQVHSEARSSSSGLARGITRLASRYTERQVTVELVTWRDRERVPEADTAPEKGTAAHGNGAAQAEKGGGAVEEADGTVDLTADEGPRTARREARVKLLAVLSFPDSDEVEVHLTLGELRTIGRAVGSSGLLAPVDATVHALRDFLPSLSFASVWAREVDNIDDRGHLVAVGLTDGRESRHGMAAGDTAGEAASRAALDALNRTLAPELAGRV